MGFYRVVAVAASFSLFCSLCAGSFEDGGCTGVLGELQRYMDTYGFRRPTRSTVNESLAWRFGPPNYDAADLLYFKGRTRNHALGSAEDQVENLVKHWEMEASHLPYSVWSTVDQEKYAISANGAEPARGSAAAAMGNYNALLQGMNNASLYDDRKHDFESSHELFRGAFKQGFPWELIEVLSSAPKVVFSWRHWAIFDGTYRGRKGDGKTYEMYGMASVSVNSVGKITDIEIYYKPQSFLQALQGEVDVEVLRRGADIFGKGIPIAGDMPAAAEGNCSFKKEL